MSAESVGRPWRVSDPVAVQDAWVGIWQRAILNRESILNHDLSFWSQPETQTALEEWIDSALGEDSAESDLTAPVLLESAADSGRDSLSAKGVITAKANGVICGLEAVRVTLEKLDSGIRVIEALDDGCAVSAGEEVFVATGSATALLAGERTALNICSHLSGIATATARLVEAAGEVKIFDTRKTLPGLRRFQKYAVTVGGGCNHRHDLADFPMFKENHRAILQKSQPQLSGNPLEEVRWIKSALSRNGFSGPISIEVEDEASLRACLKEGIEVILVDNIPPATLTEWIERALQDQIPVEASHLEASGGIDGETLRTHASSGVGRISVGAITHSSRVLDLSMSVELVS